MKAHHEQVTKALHAAQFLSSDLQAMHSSAENPAEQDAALDMIAQVRGMIERLDRLQRFYSTVQP